MTTLTINSLNQGYGYDEATTVAAFALFERLATMLRRAVATVCAARPRLVLSHA